jgi:single-strand selective monofunctional uracil DNA glycosylase
MPSRPRSEGTPSPLARISRDLSAALSRLHFGPPITHVYDPLSYARVPHEAYLSRWGRSPKTVLFVGMNPGPFGMAQTGVPFGEVSLVRDFLRIEGRVDRPPGEHPKRPVTGFSCTRSEVSGARLWGWARDRFGTPERFFEACFVANYCPLAFMEATGRNFTPDKLPAREREPLFEACDEALRRVVAELRPSFVVGVGAFALARARAALPEFAGTLGTVLHPSPASPRANQGWARLVDLQLEALGVPLG